jgi:CheY-like chemotaxis protein
MAAATVLFVEDEALISDLVCDVLSEGGFDVHLEGTADGALRYLQDGNDIDILFTDINVPGDIDGAELASKARELRPELPVIYTSGRAIPGELVPRSVFVNKPYDLDHLCKLIRRLAPTQH